MDFSYEVIRLWQKPVRPFLAGGLGTLPLAPLCRLPAAESLESALVPVIRRVVERLEQEATPEDRAKLLTATYVLAGLRVTPEVAELLFQGIRAMKESSTYQAILAEGRTEGRTEGRIEGRIEALKKTLFRLGNQRFHSPPDEAVQAAIQAITEEGRLERMTERLLIVSNWQELLATV
jgi:predicted transposase YdaD